MCSVCNGYVCTYVATPTRYKNEEVNIILLYSIVLHDNMRCKISDFNCVYLQAPTELCTVGLDYLNLHYPKFESSVIRRLFLIMKFQETIQFFAKSSDKWNACVIFRLVKLIISQYNG